MKNSLIAAALAAAAPAWAQSTLPPVVVTGNPLGSSEIATPGSVLSGDGLVLRRASSLGETLDGLPGVSSSYFGPNSNRPIIRGQDGDRIRVLGNGGASFDASSLSFDHAVPIDPLVVERIEVLRGPAALWYGGGAVGGVVNAIDNRIPTRRIEGPSGAVEMRFGGAARERAVAALVEGGANGFAFHVDAFGRRSGDLDVPAFERPTPEGRVERRQRVVNSASRAEGGALGASWAGERGYLGASVDTYRNDYGIVVEDDITIRMRRDKLALAGELRTAGAWFPTLRARAATTDYQHQEIEGDGSVGTTFATRGHDLRVEVVHRALALRTGHLEGSWGLQFESSRFSALGEEAFVPSTRTRQAAVFVLERWSWGERGHLSAGLRAERLRVQSDGDAQPAEPQFGPPRERGFSPRSASLAAVVNLSARWQLSSSWSSTQRGPTSYELYANGIHAATSAYEQGDPEQGLERGRNVDLALEWRDGANRVKVGAFDSRFSNFIALSATGLPDFVDEAGDSFPVFAFQGVRARLHGVEAEGSWRVLGGPRTLDLDGRLDLVRGQNLDRGEPLPRLAPLRASLGLTLTRGASTARLEVRHAAAQSRVPAGDRRTDGWTMVNLSASHALRMGSSDVLLFARLQNLGDTLGFSATTIGTVRPLVPLPGRSLAVGMRVAF